jgi:anti-anti-sigma factor
MAEPKPAISWAHQGDVTVIRLTASEVKRSRYAAQACRELGILAVTIGGKMLLALHNVEFFSSAGLVILVTFRRAVEMVGGELRVCGMTPEVAQVLSALDLDESLQACESVADAIRMFHSDSA